MLKIASSPENDGVATTVKLVGHLQIGRLIEVGQSQDQLATEDQSLWGGMGSGESLQPFLCDEI
jgi:hypothetical protein